MAQGTQAVAQSAGESGADWEPLEARVIASDAGVPCGIAARALVMQHRLGQDDATFAAELADRLSYRHACGAGPGDPTPDAATLEMLRREVNADGILDRYTAGEHGGPASGTANPPGEAALRAALDCLSEFCVIADTAGRILDVNATAAGVAAQPEHALIGRSLDDLIAETGYPPWQRPEAAEGVWRGRGWVMTGDGERVAYHFTVFTLADGAGFVLRGRPAATGGEPNAILNRLITHAPLPMALAGRRDGRIRVSSRRLRTLLRARGSNEGDPLMGRDATTFYVDPHVRRQLMARLRHQGEVRDLETQLYRCDGSTFDALISFAYVNFDGDDDVLVTVRDISRYRRAEADLRYRTAFHQALSELSPDGILVMDTKNNPLFHNKRFHEIFNLHPELIEAEDGEELLRYAQAQVRDPAGFLARVRYLHKNPYERGHDELTFLDGRVVERHSGPMLDRGGQLLGRIWFFRDITARKQLEDELREARDRAAAGEAAKTRFLSTMNHELRTPLNAIIGFADVIRSQTFGNDLDTYVRYAETIHESGQHLLELVSDVLDMSKLEHGAYRLNEEWVDVRDVARRCVRMVEPQANTRQVRLTNGIDDGIPPLYADERALRQMLLNLLSNGVKFAGTNGRVSLAWRVTEPGELVMAVTDTGNGIPESDIERIKKPFEQAANTLTSSNQTGSGLGLAITRSLMALHGGNLDVASQSGEGTEARLVFPAERVHSAADG